jgi:hypothetical protein
MAMVRVQESEFRRGWKKRSAMGGGGTGWGDTDGGLGEVEPSKRKWEWTDDKGVIPQRQVGVGLALQSSKEVRGVRAWHHFHEGQSSGGGSTPALQCPPGCG